MAYGDPTGVNKILVEKYGYEWVNGKAWKPGTAPEPEIIPKDDPVAATPPETSEPAETPIEEPSPSEPISLEEKIEQLQASLNELQKKYEEALEKLEQANARIAKLEGQQSDTTSDASDTDDKAVEPEETPAAEPQQPAVEEENEPVRPEAPEVTAPEPKPTSKPSYPDPTGVNKILVQKYGYEWVNGKAWKPGTAPEPELENAAEPTEAISEDDTSDTDASSKEGLKTRPSLTPLAHDVNGTTHITGLSSMVTDPYEGYPTFINGGFDFTNLEITSDLYSYLELAGPTIDEADGSIYAGMVDYSRYGDVDGDGLPELIIGGWTVNTGNAPGRLFIIDTNERGELAEFSWIQNDGTAAPWVFDFDSDGIDEIFSVGFYDFPVQPAQSFYYPDGLTSKQAIGTQIDSHESTMVDYDKDGDMDIVAISYGIETGYISFFENTGETFQHNYLVEVLGGERITGSSIEVADLNNDGDYELIIGDYMWIHNDPVIISWDQSTNSWTKQEFTLPQLYFTSETFDGINSKFTSNRPDATEVEIDGARSHEVDIKAIDLDNDGDQDLIISAGLWHDSTPMGILQIFENDGLGNFSDRTTTSLFNFNTAANVDPHDINLIDVNNDGFLDILVAEASPFNSEYSAAGTQLDLAMLSEGNNILLNDGTGHFLQTAFGFFSKPGSAWDNGLSYPGKWHGFLNSEDKLTFVRLDKSWEGHPLGEDIVYAQYVVFEKELHTGPKFVNAADYGAPGFNEFYVLRTNPDVQELVQTGVYGSALEWYLETNPSDLETFAKHAKIIGSEVDDVIHLREGNEIAIAGNGNDKIYVYDGNDTVTSGNGSDIIVISGTAGKQNQNSIKDFSLIGGDKLDLSAFGVISEAQALELTTQISEGSLITLNESTSVILEGVQITELTTAEYWIM